MTGVIVTLIVAALGAAVIGVATNLLSKEAEWMEVAPVALLRLAARRLPADVRDELYADWYADLVAELRSVEKVPISRFTVGMRFAIGMFFGARTIAKEMNQARPGAHRRPRRVTQKPRRPGNLLRMVEDLVARWFRPVEYFAQAMLRPVEYLTQAVLRPVDYLTQAMFRPVDYLTQAMFRPVDYLTQAVFRPAEYVTQAMSRLAVSAVRRER